MATIVNKIEQSNNILTGSLAESVSNRNMIRTFNGSTDFIEMHVIDYNTNNLLFTVSPFSGYKIPGNFLPTDQILIEDIIFTPDIDLQNLGLRSGNYKVQYNILRPKVTNLNSLFFFIKEISGDRTELRLITNNIDNNDVETGTINFINEIQSVNYFKEFYLNFGKNQLLPSVNIALDKNTSPYSILIKLLNPLPLNYTINDFVGIHDKISNPQVFSAEIIPDSIPISFPTLRGPNFDLDLDNLRIGPTPYYNFNQITSFQGNFAPQLQRLLGQLSASNFSININYANFEYEDWIHFSSAARRLEGFQYKLSNIELFTSASSSAAASTSPSAQLDTQLYQNKINNTIQSFDGWEQYLYYETGAYAWPKSNLTKPYINYPVTSSQAAIWYSGSYTSASLYDDNNQNYLLYAMPGYIAENTDNELVFKFVASIGQMFDDIWIHIKAISDLYQTKNSLTQGISKDLVYFALQSMGIDVYTDQDGKNVFQYLYGVNSNGTYKPITGSYETLVSASNYQMSGQDQQKSIYKRLYHSLPLLLKSKGTTRFIQYLNTIFGIPPTIMGYTEYGGVDKLTATTEYEFDRFTYALKSSGSNTISIPWVYTSQSYNRTGYNDIAPNGIEFRFKAFTTASNILLSTYPTQSLFYNGANYSLRLLYTDTGSGDSIYSGSTGKFGYLQFNLGSTSITSSTVPVFMTGSNDDTDWYSVLVQRRFPNRRIGDVGTSQTYDIYIKNNVWGEIGHKASASLTTSTQNSSWYTNGTTLTFGGGTYPFSGSIQEVRLWSNYLSESKFDFHVLNPESYESNYTSSAFNDLAARFTLGNNLSIYNHSITTQVYSTHPDQKTQILTASFTNFPNSSSYSSFVERYYANVANSGYANPVTDKVRIYSGSEYGTQLLPNKSIEISPILPITKDLHLLDASLSPQDEIDRDIIANLGSTYDIDQFIGDPRGTEYNTLDNLRFDYFKKYVNKYNYKDYIRLIEFFHNSLFRTLKDFTPARTNLATGVVIKPHLLERPFIPIQRPNTSRHNNLSQSIDTAFITASNGMVYTQPIYNYYIGGNLGRVNMISDGRDFFTGELPSSSIPIYNNFVEYNFNPFAVGVDSGKTSSYSESIWNVNFNPLLNNVSDNQISNTKKLLTLIGGNVGFIKGSNYTTESYQYQDFTDDYRRHADPRYNGSNTTSTEYNTFSEGPDDSYDLYGKNAAIDKNTRQFAFFSEVVASGSQLLAMPERSNVYIKYLIDENSNLTELTKRNYDRLTEDQKYNLYQVQNIFKSGDVVNISLFDYQNPTNQVNLDGNKDIFVGGYKFHPVLWRTGSEALYYQLDPSFFPQGNTNATHAPGEFRVEGIRISNRISLNPRWQFYVSKRIGSVLVDTIVSYRVRVYRSFGYVDRYFTGFIPRGGVQSGNSPTVDGISFTMNYAYLTADAGKAGQINFEVADGNPFLTIDSKDNSFISCSIKMSQFYPGFYFTGSGQYSSTPDYRFELNPGDLVRFSSGSVFIPESEREIIDVNAVSGSRVTFRINGEVPNYATGSLNQINTFIFSRKIPDETNIVIQHRKNSGETSAGIAKNSNLAVDVDAKLANIVSDLKSRIFSTVLIP